MTSQLLLDLPTAELMTFDSFLPLAGNQSGYEFMVNLSHQTGSGVLYGDHGAGKSHLLYALGEALGATVITPNSPLSLAALPSICLADDIDGYDQAHQEQLFHLFNHISAEGGIFVATATVAVGRCECLIPELKSRLLTLPQYELALPDSSALELLCVKLLADRQLQAEPKVVHYLVSRIGRRVDILQQLVQRIDDKSLRDQRKITIALVRDILKEDDDTPHTA